MAESMQAQSTVLIQPSPILAPPSAPAPSSTTEEVEELKSAISPETTPKKNALKGGALTHSDLNGPSAAKAVSGKTKGTLHFVPGAGWQPIESASKNQSQAYGGKTEPTVAAGSTSAVSAINSIDLSSMTGAMQLSREGLDKTTALNSSAVTATPSNPAKPTDSILTGNSSDNSRLSKQMNVSSGGHGQSGTQAGLSEESIKSFEGKAYVSPVQLREMMREAPDLESRIRLRRLSEREDHKNPGSSSHASSRDSENRSSSHEQSSLTSGTSKKTATSEHSHLRSDEHLPK